MMAWALFCHDFDLSKGINILSEKCPVVLDHYTEPDANMEIGKLQASVNEVLLMALREVSEYLYSLDGEYLAEVAEHLHVCLYDYCNQPMDSE